MVQGIGNVSFTCKNSHSIDMWLYSFLKENYKLKNLLANVEKVLKFLPLVFFNRDGTIDYLVIISKL